MESTDAILKILHDLLRINKDRVEGYKKASYDTQDPGLKALFANMADQARKNVTDIMKEIINHNGNVETSEITTPSNLTEAWTALKNKFTGNSVKHVLTLCESREAAALHIYQKVKNKAFNAQVTSLIERHELSLKSSHEVIKVYRQAYLKLDKMSS